MDLDLAATGNSEPEAGSLDVSLVDGDLAEEVELTARLMVAANESDHRLPVAEIDRILRVVA